MNTDEPRFTHLDGEGRARMVDISGKEVVRRTARAAAVIRMAPATVSRLREQALPKGDALGAARLAGIAAAKRTADLIPLCHPLPIDTVDVEFEVHDDAVTITARAVCTWKTGIEMEALTAAAVAALTLYDMCKAVDKGMEITGIRLLEKTKEPL